MKKLAFLFAITFCASLAFAQTDVDLDQSGESAYWSTGLINQANVQQEGTNVSADYDQTAGTYNKLKSLQGGINLSATLDANAGTYNEAKLRQHGNNQDIDIEQVAFTEKNYAQTWQESGNGYTSNNNDIDVVQQAGTYNYLLQRQNGENHVVDLYQEAGTYNRAETYQGQWNTLETDNVLYGASLGTWGPLYASDEPATQKSTTSYNELKVDQNGSFNKVGLYQEGYDFNYADIFQEGGYNSLLIYQINTDGYNSVISTQTGGYNSASVLQDTYSGSGTITVDQN